MSTHPTVRLSGDGDRTLCFRHATLRALQGEEINLDVYEFDPEWTNSKRYLCADCMEESK